MWPFKKKVEAPREPLFKDCEGDATKMLQKAIDDDLKTITIGEMLELNKATLKAHQDMLNKVKAYQDILKK